MVTFRRVDSFIHRLVEAQRSAQFRISLLDFRTYQGVPDSHAVSFFGGWRILEHNTLIREQLKVVLRCCYPNLQGFCYVASRGGAVFCQIPNDCNLCQVPEGVNNSLQGSS
jgi:hypothetical protein